MSSFLCSGIGGRGAESSRDLNSPSGNFWRASTSRARFRVLEHFGSGCWGWRCCARSDCPVGWEQDGGGEVRGLGLQRKQELKGRIDLQERSDR